MNFLNFIGTIAKGRRSEVRLRVINKSFRGCFKQYYTQLLKTKTLNQKQTSSTGNAVKLTNRFVNFSKCGPTDPSYRGSETKCLMQTTTMANPAVSGKFKQFSRRKTMTRNNISSFKMILHSIMQQCRFYNVPWE